MWQFTFEAPVGTRILSDRFMGICHYLKDYSDTHLWWCDEQKQWMPIDEVLAEHGCSSHAPGRSFKAFKRHLRKHPELKVADEVVLCSRFKGYDIIAKWVE